MTTSYKETFDRFSLYFLAILISPILFGGILAIYSILSFEDSWGFGPTVLLGVLYSFPFFVFAAFPISLYIDFSVRFKGYPNWIKALLFAGFGSLAGLLGSVVLYDLFPITFMFLFGMIGGLIHFLILALIKKGIR
ncbi:hypothetical protein ACXYMX_16950 [Sporosarcina sp. CAU 1771]